MGVALAAVDFFINLGMVENTGGLSVPGSKVHDNLKSARRSTLAHMNEDKRVRGASGQESAAEIELEMDSGME